MHSHNTLLENKKFFELMNEGYRDGIRRQDRDGISHMEYIAHCGILPTIQADDVIPILPPAVG